MNIKKQTRYSVIFIFTLSILSFENCLAVQVIGATATPANTKEHSLTGNLKKITGQEVQTTVGTFQIDRFVKINDLRDAKQAKQEGSNVQLLFKNNQVTTIIIY